MRLKNIILTELVHKRLIAYEELECVMNNKGGDIQYTKAKVTEHLKDIIQLNAMISEWESINREPLGGVDIDKLKNLNKKENE
tara:strand:+ start:3790 stop:4038 length:249 start_codon:yes stop_codon:yes gene_type:complete